MVPHCGTVFPTQKVSPYYRELMVYVLADPLGKETGSTMWNQTMDKVVPHCGIIFPTKKVSLVCLVPQFGTSLLLHCILVPHCSTNLFQQSCLVPQCGTSLFWFHIVEPICIYILVWFHIAEPICCHSLVWFHNVEPHSIGFSINWVNGSTLEEPAEPNTKFAISLLKAPSSAFTFKNLLRHYAKWAFKHGKYK